MKYIALSFLPVMTCLTFLPGVAGEAEDETDSHERGVTIAIVDQVGQEANGFLAGVGQLIDERIGWLRPVSTKDLAAEVHQGAHTCAIYYII